MPLTLRKNWLGCNQLLAIRIINTYPAKTAAVIVAMWLRPWKPWYGCVSLSADCSSCTADSWVTAAKRKAAGSQPIFKVKRVACAACHVVFSPRKQRPVTEPGTAPLMVSYDVNYSDVKYFWAANAKRHEYFTKYILNWLFRANKKH